MTEESLSLLQGYSSAEEEEHREEEEEEAESQSDSSSPSDDEPPSSQSHAGSLLPSAFDAFSQVSGPPQFLNTSVQHQPSIDVAALPGRRKTTNLPPGAVMEAKAQLVGIHERVRSDIEGSAPPDETTKKGGSSASTLPESGKRVVTATNPDAKDASELLRMCLQCGVPKTYSNARGMICPECGDRPPSDEASLKKKGGSTVKDKEKVKRMRGQSSHASWKSETEMHLRQQFD